MSIDDPRQVRFLIEKMEASLPIPVRATPETLKIAETKGERYKPDHQFSIDKIFYTGDEGGIICSLKNESGKQTILVCSLTHLRKVSESKNILTKTAGWVTVTPNPPHPIIFGE